MWAAREAAELCARCGDRIGAYEPIVWERADGGLVPGGLMSIPVAALGSHGSRLFHRGCLERAPRAVPDDDRPRVRRPKPAGLERPSLRVLTEDSAPRSAPAATDRLRAYAAPFVRAMADGLLLTRDGVILDVNDAACALTGFSRDELLASTPPYPFDPGNAADEMAREGVDICDVAAASVRRTLTRKDRSQFDALISTVVVEADDGDEVAYASTIRDITGQARRESELERLASHDPLTGVANQGAFHERLRDEAARAIRHARQMSIVLLDVDHFKQINDRHGHPVGDRVLVEIARRLRHLVRGGELLARIGGDEFGWILPDADATGAFAAAERARCAIGSAPFHSAGTLTLSCGVCALQHARDPADLYKSADLALYQAKRHGRNQTAGHPE